MSLEFRHALVQAREEADRDSLLVFTGEEEKVRAFLKEKATENYEHPKEKNEVCNEMLSVLLDPRYNPRINKAFIELFEKLDVVFNEIQTIFHLSAIRHEESMSSLSEFIDLVKNFRDFLKQITTIGENFNKDPLHTKLNISPDLEKIKTYAKFVPRFIYGDFAYIFSPKTKEEVINERVEIVWKHLEENRSLIKPESYDFYFSKIYKYMNDGKIPPEIKFNPFKDEAVIIIDKIKTETVENTAEKEE